MNSVSPDSTPYGASAPGDSHTTMQIDSGVCPGVARDSRPTCPNSMARHRSVAVREVHVRDLPETMTAPVAAASPGAGEKIGVHVGLDNVVDAQPAGGRVVR